MSFEEEKELMARNAECLERKIKEHNRRCDDICRERREIADCDSLFHFCVYCTKNLKIEE